MDLREQLLALDDIATKKVDVPIWNRKLTIREMGLKESLTTFNPKNLNDDGGYELEDEGIAFVIANCVIDPETGERVYLDEDIPALARKNRVALMFLYNEITALSGSVEDAEKN